MMISDEKTDLVLQVRTVRMKYELTLSNCLYSDHTLLKFWELLW